MRSLLLILSLSPVVINGCQFTKSGKTCATGGGLLEHPYTGTSLLKNQLILTFDGGPNAATAEVEAVLYANGIQGTFFVGGHNIVGQEATLTSMKAHGHLLGNHTYTEAAFANARDPEREVRRTDALLLPYITGDIFLLRPAGGATLSADLVAQLKAAGLSRYVGPIGWDIGDTGSGGVTADSDCWAAGLTANACADGYLEGITTKNHGVVRMQGTASQTADLLRALLPRLLQQFTFARLDAVPEVQLALTSASARTGTAGGAPGCDEY